MALKVERSGGSLVNCGKAEQTGSLSTAAQIEASSEAEGLTGTFSEASPPPGAKLTLPSYPGVLSGVQAGEANKLIIEGGRSVECGEVTYAGEYKESEVAEEMASVTPQYKNCTATILGNLTPATITTNGCSITFSFGAFSNATNATGQAHLRCPEGKKVEIHVWKTIGEDEANATAFCTYTLPEQTVGTAGSIEYQANGTHEQLTVSGSAMALQVERSGGSLTNCGKATQTGSLSTTALIEAASEGEGLTGTFS